MATAPITGPGPGPLVDPQVRDPQADALPPRNGPPAGPVQVQDQDRSDFVANSMLTAGVFVGAGMAMWAGVPVVGWIIAAVGAFIFLEGLLGLVGMSPVKMLTGRSIGGWINAGIESFAAPRPREPENAGVNIRRQGPAAVAPRREEPVERQDLAPLPVPTS